MKLFSDSLPFYKANFHCHTTNSDGRLTPEKCMSRYRDEGYEVLAITDHRKVTHPEQVPEGLLLIPGIELDFMIPHQAVHILGLGVEDTILSAWNPAGTPQEAVDAIIRCGGAAVLAHPAWSMNTTEFIASLKGLTGTEIWNSVSTLPTNADRADSSSLLDTTWANYGSLMPVFANDDSHTYGSEFAVGATMVQAEKCTREGIMEALKAGRFYATQGPEFRQITVEDGVIRVSCSPADAVIFYSDMPWVAGRVIMGSKLTEAAHTIHPKENYIRVEIRDQRGRKAWSAPIAVK